MNNDHPVVCTASGASCPTGYFCQFSDRNKQFQCCGHKAGCPGDSVAYLDLTGGAQECSVKLRNCPEGYSCQNSKGGKTICCTARIGGRDRPMIGEGSSNITIAPGAPETPGATVPPPTMSPSVTSGGNPGKSLCPPDTALINGECKVRGAVGSVCLLSSQCTSGAECVGQMCACGKKFREQDGRCIQVDTDEVVKEVVVAKEVIRPVLAGCKENQVEVSFFFLATKPKPKPEHGTGQFRNQKFAEKQRLPRQIGNWSGMHSRRAMPEWHCLHFDDVQVCTWKLTLQG